jgi:TIR domain
LNPRTFISYSWTSPEHELVVLNLATELREAGVDAILDKWDLREGQEATAFMEKMVADQSVSKVVMVVDRAYAEKSNARTGGAGTEAQIISKELYEQKDNTKFVALVLEKGLDGRAVLPAYYSSRIYIDFSDGTRYPESFDQLLRWLHDKPLLKKPELGLVPSYLTDERNDVRLLTDLAYRKCIQTVSANASLGIAATKEFFDRFLAELPKFRLPEDFDPSSEQFSNNLASFIPYRDQVVEVIRQVARCTNDSRYFAVIHKFFEGLLAFFDARNGRNQSRDIDADNFIFFSHELILSSVAVALAEGRADITSYLIRNHYYDRSDRYNGTSKLVSFDEFSSHIKSFTIRRDSLSANRYSLHADYLKQRNSHAAGWFDQIMQADFVLYLASKARLLFWRPTSLFYAARWHPAFELFDRAQQPEALQFLVDAMGLTSSADFFKILKTFENDHNAAPRFDLDRLDPIKLAGAKDLHGYV